MPTYSNNEETVRVFECENCGENFAMTEEEIDANDLDEDYPLCEDCKYLFEASTPTDTLA